MLQRFDKRNQSIQVFVKDRLLPREEAKISVFDSSVQGGDAVWEGLRLYKNGIFLLSKHLDRLEASARALLFNDIPDRGFIHGAIFKTLTANGMSDETHIRLTLTRGEKITSGMDPRLNQSGCCLIVLAEWKPPVYDSKKGIRIITSSIRRNAPEFLDSKIHHNNLLNNILAKIQANQAGVDAALMLDKNGFAAELNDTNIFLVKNGRLYTPYSDACLPGITRELIMEIAREINIHVMEKNVSPAELYTADEVFCTGTMGELTPVGDIDGRIVRYPDGGPVTDRIKNTFRKAIQKWCEPIA